MELEIALFLAVLRLSGLRSVRVASAALARMSLDLVLLRLDLLLVLHALPPFGFRNLRFVP